MAEKKVHEYRGRDVIVRWDARICIHAAECLRGAHEVFDTRRTPWVTPDAASPEKVIEVIGQCPSGALSYERVGGSTAAEAGTQPLAPVADASANRIILKPNGAFVAKGNVVVVDAEGKELRRAASVSLCRCGASEEKPFCDGSHHRIGFTDPGQVAEPKVRVDESFEGEELRIEVRPGGSLAVSGPFELQSNENEILCSGHRTALCRCGASANKPFCDGSHKKIGFDARA